MFLSVKVKSFEKLALKLSAMQRELTVVQENKMIQKWSLSMNKKLYILNIKNKKSAYIL